MDMRVARAQDLKVPLVRDRGGSACMFELFGCVSKSWTTHAKAENEVVIDAGDALWVRKDPDGILALMRLLEAGFLRLAEADPGLCAARLPRAFHALTPQVRMHVSFKVPPIS
eukprot:1146157-Pelagomonas_calceolata.AAC.1